MSQLRILVVGSFRLLQHEPAVCRALRELGHLVQEAPMRLPASLLGRAQDRFAFGPQVALLNRALVEAARAFRPDVILCYRALLVHPRTVLALRTATRAKLVSFNNDDVFGPLGRKAYFRLFKRAIPHYDLHLVYRDADLARYRRAGARRVQQLRSFYLPWLHHPRAMDELAGLHADVVFYGHCEPDRRLDELDSLMRRVPASYRVRGSGWREHGAGRAWQDLDTTEIAGEAYARSLAAARLALCFFSTWNRDTYTRRVFEIPACAGSDGRGPVLVAQRTADMASLYEDGREAVFFDDTEELVARVRHLLDHEEERARIAAAGHARCMRSGYAIHDRMNEWLKTTSEL